MKVLGFLGDVVQLAITGTTGLGTLAGNLANSRYNRAASERAYADSRADTAWEQQMKELQRQDSLTQQQYKTSWPNGSIRTRCASSSSATILPRRS